MSKPYTGGCACGAIRYEIAAEPVFSNECQCRQCQQVSGSGHGSYMSFVGKEAVKLQGKTSHWTLIADSGKRSAFLLRVKAGKPVPRHTHRGIELTLVLTGAYCDAANCFVRGDIQVADPTIDHQPMAQAGEDCICLVALEAPIWFTGPVGRLANPFVKL